jgi:hypothetical protein
MPALSFDLHYGYIGNSTPPPAGDITQTVLSAGGGHENLARAVIVTISRILRWRRCHEVTEVETELPAGNLDKHYGYINTSTPYPRQRGTRSGKKQEER